MTLDELELEYDKMIKALESHPDVKGLEFTGYDNDEVEEDEDTGELLDATLSREFTFTAGNIGRTPIIAGGWVEMRYEPYVSSDKIYGNFLMGLARNGEFNDKRMSITGEEKAYQGNYDAESNSWDDDFVIDGY